MLIKLDDDTLINTTHMKRLVRDGLCFIEFSDDTKMQIDESAFQTLYDFLRSRDVRNINSKEAADGQQ